MIAFAKIYYLVFGLLTLMGGIMGYVKASSWISLIAGVITGALLLYAAYLLPGRPQPAFITALIVSVALAGQFLPKFIETKAPFPAGVMTLLSLGGLAVTLLAWYAKK